MFRWITGLITSLVVFAITPAEARHHYRHVAHVVVKAYAADSGCNLPGPNMMRCEGVAPSPRGLRVVKAMGGWGVAKEQYTPPVREVRAVSRERSDNFSSSSFGSIGKPSRYIGGRLVCAINVGVALAERGIKGTGSALAHSYDHWGVATPVPVVGGVAVSDRRGGGHVAIVSRVEGGRVWVWNATGGHNGWYEMEYTNRRARYRVAG